MEKEKYVKLRDKFRTKDFETDHSELDKWLYGLSFIGNIFSILFSVFLVYPISYKTLISYGIGNGFSVFLGFTFAVFLLSIFEYLKRLVLTRFSIKLVEDKNNVLKLESISWLLFSFILVGCSFYFSVTGAKNFGTVSEKSNTTIESIISIKVDSISKSYSDKILTYEIENNKLRSINNDLRSKILNLAETDKNTRNGFQLLIDKNILAIDGNDKKIEQINIDSENKTAQYIKKQENKMSKNADSDISFIILYVFFSIAIETFIIIGVYYRQWYDFKLFSLNEDKMEYKSKTKDRYTVLLKYIYNLNNNETGSAVVGLQKLKVELSNKINDTDITNIQAYLNTFYTVMDNLGIFKARGKRRVINMPLNKALLLIENIKDEAPSLENFK